MTYETRGINSIKLLFDVSDVTPDTRVGGGTIDCPLTRLIDRLDFVHSATRCGHSYRFEYIRITRYVDDDEIQQGYTRVYLDMGVAW